MAQNQKIELEEGAMGAGIIWDFRCFSSYIKLYKTLWSHIVSSELPTNFCSKQMQRLQSMTAKNSLLKFPRHILFGLVLNAQNAYPQL